MTEELISFAERAAPDATLVDVSMIAVAGRDQ